MAVKEITAAFDPRERVRKLAEQARPEVRDSLQAWSLWFGAQSAPETAPPVSETPQADPLAAASTLAATAVHDPGRILWEYVQALVAEDGNPEWFEVHAHVTVEQTITVRGLVEHWRELDRFLALGGDWLLANPQHPQAAARREDYGCRLERWTEIRDRLACLCEVCPERLLAALQGEPWPPQEDDDYAV